MVSEGEVLGVQLVEDVLVLKSRVKKTANSLESECKFEHKTNGGIWTVVLAMEWTESLSAESEHTEWFGV